MVTTVSHFSSDEGVLKSSWRGDSSVQLRMIGFLSGFKTLFSSLSITSGCQVTFFLCAFFAPFNADGGRGRDVLRFSLGKSSLGVDDDEPSSLGGAGGN